MPVLFILIRPAEQTVLSVVIVLCCVTLTLARGRRPAAPVPRPRKRGWVRPVALTVVLLAVAAFLAERGDDPIGVRPDSWSDANVVVAGRNYAREGLFAHAGAHQLQVITDQNPSDPFFLYTRYPVGAGLINGMWQIAGVRSDRAFRLLPAACSLTALVLWYGLYRRITGPAVAAVATIAMALSYGFLAYADNLHFHAYGMLTSVAAMRCYLRAMDLNERQRLRWFLLTALFMFVTAWFTWEYHLWMVLFIGVYALLFRCPVRRSYLALLAAPLLVALAMQTIQRHVAFAGIRGGDAGGGFLEDVYRRTVGLERAVDTPPGLTLAGYPAMLAQRYYTFYGLPAPAVLAMIVMLLMPDRRAPWRIRDWPDGARLAVALFLAGAGWWIVMIQHTAVHPHVMRQSLSAYALLMALVWVRCWDTARSADFGRPVRAAAVLLMLALCYPQIEGLICDLRVHYAGMTVDDRARGDTGTMHARQFTPLQRIVPEGAVILTNHNRLPLMRLWSQRPVYSGATYGFPPNDPEHARLILEMRFNHLRELYQDRLPPLYYVYRMLAPSLESAFGADELLRFLLTGRSEGGPEAWKQAGPVVSEAMRTRNSDGLFCPIVAIVENMIVFRLDPAVPLLRKEWEAKGSPTLREFGPTR
jgi:hypothetical protein